MPAIAYLIIVVGWVVWVLPFVLMKRNTSAPAKLDRRARWGLLLEIAAFTLLWQGRFWLRSPELWRLAVSVLFFVLAGLLSWTATRALGRQWRIDAGLNPDHELVRSGPYRVVRHPIYASLLCLFLGQGVLIGSTPLLLIATLLFLAGTEIRVRIEDKLLESRFGGQFTEYRSGTPAYVPLVR